MNRTQNKENYYYFFWIVAMVAFIAHQIVGAIEYPDKSYFYVRDAAENWINNIMTTETVKNYTKQLDLFSK